MVLPQSCTQSFSFLVALPAQLLLGPFRAIVAVAVAWVVAPPSGTQKQTDFHHTGVGRNNLAQ